MTTTVVLASEGQLGSLILRLLRNRNIAAQGVDIDTCNLEDPASIQRLFERFPKMKRLYNAAAFTAVDAAEEQPRRVFRVNALGPGFLATRCEEREVELVHFSTDYVFGPGFEEPIGEEAKAEPISVYGRSKLLGEKLVMDYHPQAKILRSCGLYSADMPNFVRTMVRLGLKGSPIEVVADQIITPTPAARLAELAVTVAEEGCAGIYHATPHGECSWYEFTEAIFEELDLSVEVRPLDSQSWKAPAARPAYSVLDNGLLGELGLDSFRDWREELSTFLQGNGEAILAHAEQEIRQAS